MVSGQRTVTTKSRKPQIALKVRKGMVTGAKVVLRQFLKYNFLDKFLTVTLPRIKEFTGFKKIMVTTSGNFSFRIQEPLNFMELEYEYNKFTTLPSMDVTLVTSVENKIKSLCVLASLGVPFLKKTDYTNV
jgi:large subunit ribosomal protein L5